MSSPDRRDVLKGAALAALLAALPEAAVAAQPPQLGPRLPFSFDWLKDLVRRKAAEPYQAPQQPAPEIMDQLTYEAWGQVTYDTDRALFAGGPGKFPVTFFHLGKFFRKSVEMHVVEGDEAREIVYDPSLFHMPADSPARKLSKGAGFAGLRIQEPRTGKLDWHKNDWVAFLGAAYFRSIGELYQYGLSARAIAIDTALGDRPEEFPDFTRFYIVRGKDGDDSLTVYALLEGASIVGAYKFVMTRAKAVIMDIDAMVILRRPVGRFGLAPLTSMYWFSETVKGKGADWRPEVHDSDGLAILTGYGAHLWRPLNDPPHLQASAFIDENPKGFGLLQRDRVFDHYLDGVYYDRRPSLWVEPKSGWGKGAIQLIELTTDDEINDNVVAMWVPERAPEPGAELAIAYRLYWQADEPTPSPLARCVATRLGLGGQAGQPRPPGVRKFVVEFLGGPLGGLKFGEKPDFTVEVARGRVTDYRLVEPVPDGVAGHWRIQFDLADVSGSDPVELKLNLTVNGQIASETWLFQYHPF